MTKRTGFFAALFVTCIILSFQGGVCEDDVSYKADFILKLVDYVQWPAGAGTSDDGSVVVGVAGGSPILDALKSKAAEKSAGAKKITIREVTLETATQCQILMITTTDKTVLAKILKQLGTAPVLTVSDCQGFAGFGVMINFFKEEGTGKTKFEANTLAAGDANLKISSQLLKLAKIV